MPIESSRTFGPRRRMVRGIATFAALLAGFASTGSSADTIARIKSTGKIKLGYLTDATPFSFEMQRGSPERYGVALCEKIRASITAQLALPGLSSEWVRVDPERRLRAIQNGDVDLLCTPMSVTLERREAVSYSIPVFAGGNRAAVRTDAPAHLRNALSKASGDYPAWRGSSLDAALGKTKLAVVSNTASEQWLRGRRDALNLEAQILTLPSYDKAVKELLAGDVDVVFGDRVLILGALAAMSREEREQVVMLERLFTHEPTALALPRNDDDFRLLVDRALSEFYGSQEFVKLYTRWSGEFDQQAETFFGWSGVAR